MPVDYTNISCGVLQLHGLHEQNLLPNGTMVPRPWEEVLNPLTTGSGCAFVIFSDHDRGVYESAEEAEKNTGRRHTGRYLAEFIREKELGNLIETEQRVNPNSGNHIRMWVWSPEWDKLRKLITDYRDAKAEKKKAAAAAVKAAKAVVTKTIPLDNFITKMKIAPKSVKETARAGK